MKSRALSVAVNQSIYVRLKKNHGTHLTIKSRKVGSSHVIHILWRSEWHPCRARIFGNPGVHFISHFALKRVYVCA